MVLKIKNVMLKKNGFVLAKKVVEDDLLKEILSKNNGYEQKMKIYKEYWISDIFINQNEKLINWDLLCKYQPLSKKMIDKYHLKIDFDILISHQTVSQKTILQYKHRINSDILSKNHFLTESFIEKYADVFGMHWGNIVFYQPVSLQFLIKHKDRFDESDLDGSIISADIVDEYKVLLKMGCV